MTWLLWKLLLRPSVHVAGAETADCAGRVRAAPGDLPDVWLRRRTCRRLDSASAAPSSWLSVLRPPGFRPAVSRGHGALPAGHTPPIRPPQGEQAALLPTLPFSSTTAQPGNGGPPACQLGGWKPWPGRSASSASSAPTPPCAPSGRKQPDVARGGVARVQL